MKSVFRPLSFVLAVAAATAAADGFFDPPAPAPERVAALDPLCARLETLGMPAVPPGSPSSLDFCFAPSAPSTHAEQQCLAS